MRPDVAYIPYATSSREQTGDIIKFTQFKEGDLLYETHENAEIGDEYDGDSIMLPLIREK